MLEYNPNLPSAYVTISRILVKMNKLDDSLELLLKARGTEFYKEKHFKNSIDWEIEDVEEKMGRGYKYKPKKTPS